MQFNYFDRRRTIRRTIGVLGGWKGSAELIAEMRER